MTRRGMLAGLGLAGVRPARAPEQPQVAVWHAVKCPKCGRDVCFLPGQRRNTCAWDGTKVRRGVE